MKQFNSKNSAQYSGPPQQIFGRQDHYSGGHNPGAPAYGAFFIAKSRQDFGIGGLASRGSPGILLKNDHSL